MRKNNKANFVFFEETDIGCQEKKTHNIPLNEDDLEQIAKEEFMIGLIKAFIYFKKKMTIEKFWGLLEPKFKYIKNKPSWLRSDKWEGTLTVSLNKQYYLDLCQYYINAKYDSKFIYFPDEVVEESNKLAEIVINDNFLDPKYMKDNMSERICINPFGWLLYIVRNMSFCIKSAEDFKEKINNPSVFNDFRFYDSSKDPISSIRSFSMTVESSFDRSFAYTENMILLAKAFSRHDIVDEIEKQFEAFKRTMINVLDKLSDYITKKVNAIMNYEVELKRNTKIIKKLEHYHIGTSWYGSAKELHANDIARDNVRELTYVIRHSKEELNLLISFQSTFTDRINYEKDN